MRPDGAAVVVVVVILVIIVLVVVLVRGELLCLTTSTHATSGRLVRLKCAHRCA